MDDDLRQVMAKLHEAAHIGDTETTETLMTEGYIQTDVTGHVLGRSEWLDTYARPLANLIQSGVFHWERYEESGVQVRIYGDAAIVMGVLELKGHGARWGEKGTWVPNQAARPQTALRYTRVFVKDHGAWKLAAIHNAAMAPTDD